jgi:predicted ribosome quality control (RQC) complex YloA/Tae2 family protein
MVRLVLDISKSLEQNAEQYFEKAKKARKKVEGARETVEAFRKKIAILEKSKEKFIAKENAKKAAKSAVEKKWYHKFRWFRTSDDVLVIGGRDATTNEIIVKKHAEKGDLVFHTDMAGSPFFLLKLEGSKPSKEALQEAADATCSYSRAWKLGLPTQSVFYVNPDQLTKETQSGEYITKGAFVVKGKANYADNKINLAIGITGESEIMAGPVEAVKAHCGKYVEITQGDDKPSAAAKKIQAKIGGDLDSIIRAMPSGGIKIKK